MAWKSSTKLYPRIGLVIERDVWAYSCFRRRSHRRTVVRFERPWIVKQMVKWQERDRRYYEPKKAPVVPIEYAALYKQLQSAIRTAQRYNDQPGAERSYPSRGL